MPQPLTIWCSVDLAPHLFEMLREGVKPHRLVQPAGKPANNLAGGVADSLLEQADIAFGQADPEQIMRLPRLRWVQFSTAGYTRYDTPHFRDAVKKNGTIVCNASSVYSEPCAQHVVAMMLALARRLPQSLDNQRGAHGWPYLPLRAESKLLNGQTVLLVGYGAIGKRIAELLTPFRMNVIGFRRTVRRDARSPESPALRAGTQPEGLGFVEVRSVQELDDWLPKADHVVNILPATTETGRFFDAKRFAKFKPEAHYYNIGRGSTNDEAALQAALEQKQFAAAYIDAFETEPLPRDHLLWTTPNCYVIPHTGGGHSNEYDRHVDQFLENLRRFECNEPLIDRIM